LRDKAGEVGRILFNFETSLQQRDGCLEGAATDPEPHHSNGHWLGVNSFLTDGKTRHTADADLGRKPRAEKY
jgi:hypothetical protein